MNEINTKKKVKSISTLNHITLCTTITHSLQINVLFEVINFAFPSKTRSRISFPKTTVYWTTKGCGRRYLTRQTLIDDISCLTTNVILLLETWCLSKRFAFFWSWIKLYIWEAFIYILLSLNMFSKKFSLHK